MSRPIPDAALKLIDEFEGNKLRAYQDDAGVWTIGRGHTKGVKRGDTCTEEQSLRWFLEDAREAADLIEKYISVPLSSNQFAALLSFTFNFGGGSLRSSTLRRVLNLGLYDKVPEQLMRWNKVRDARTGQKVVSRGLARRRDAEIKLWNTK